MRRLLFAFLIVLMPLRGWAGDVMAVHMLTQSPAAEVLDATVSIADHAHSMWAGGSNDSHEPVQVSAPVPAHDDCAGHHDRTAEPPAQAVAAGHHGPSATGDCKTCSACQICHTVAVEPSVQTTAALHPARYAQPGDVSYPMASAVLAPGLKPPIF